MRCHLTRRSRAAGQEREYTERIGREQHLCALIPDRQLHDATQAELRAGRASSSGGDTFDREKKKQALKRLKVRKAITLIVERAEKKPLDDTFLADALLGMSWHDTAVDICKRRDLETGKGKRPEEVLEAFRKKLTPDQVRGLLVETLVTRGAYFAYSIGDADTLKAAAKLYGVDLEKCGAEAKAEIQSKEAEKRAREKARAAKEKKKSAPPAKGKKTTGKAAARELPRGTAEELGAEACLDCGVAADLPSSGCEECDHGRSKKAPTKKVEPLDDLVGTREEAEKRHREKLEQEADELLKNAGAGELTKKDTKGDAVARKGARR
jgi:hypothetical protein